MLSGHLCQNIPAVKDKNNCVSKIFFLPSAESFSPVEDMENFWMIFMQGECFFYCALACLEEETKTKIPNMPDPSDTSWELFCPISWAVCVIPVGRIGMEKKLLLIDMCMYSSSPFS